MLELLIASPELLQLFVQFPALAIMVWLVHRVDQRLATLNENLSASRREEAAIHAAIASELGIKISTEVPHG